MGSRLFRLNIEVGSLEEAAEFYGALLGQQGRLQMGRRVYFDAGGVTLQVVQADAPHLAAKALYFAVADVDAVHARGAELGCLSGELVHGMPAGARDRGRGNHDGGAESLRSFDGSVYVRGRDIRYPLRRAVALLDGRPERPRGRREHRVSRVVLPALRLPAERLRIELMRPRAVRRHELVPDESAAYCVVRHGCPFVVIA